MADVVGDQGLEEPSGPARAVEDQRPGHLDLAHGELPPIAGSPVLFAEGIGDHGDPAVEEALDIVGTEGVADGLEASGLGAGGKAVGQLAEVQATSTGLAFGPFVPVYPDLGRVGEVGADLDDEPAWV